MANIKTSLDELMTLDGAMCAAVVDYSSGMMLGSVGSGLDMEMAAAGNLITLGSQYHLIRPSARNEGVFVYFVLDKQRSNLAMARRKLQDVDKELTI